MAHKKKIIDTDKHFEIDPITRVIRNMSPSKVSVMQYDHNSERFTFTLPKSIEGHDMMECNRIEVHYINTDSTTKESKKGVYEVSDLAVSPEDENSLTCSWLLSQNATQKVGKLSFLLRFACVDAEGVIEYVWNTGIFTGISVSSGMYNSEIIIEQYADILEQWKNELNTGGGNVDLSGYVEKVDGKGLVGVEYQPGEDDTTIVTLEISVGNRTEFVKIPAYTSDLTNDSGFVEKNILDYRNERIAYIMLVENHTVLLGTITAEMLESLEMETIPVYMTPVGDNELDFEASTVFRTDNAVLPISHEGISITWAGEDCSEDGYFYPQPNTTYELHCKKLGDMYSIRVGTIVQPHDTEGA